MKAASILKKIGKGVKASLEAINWKNVVLFFGFFILAFIFWLMLFFRRDVEGTYRIPIKYTNIPNDVVFETSPPEFIEVRVADKGSEIFGYDLYLSQDSLEIDIQKMRKDGAKAIQGNQFIQLIRTSLSSSSQLLGYAPASISLAMSKLQHKELKVVFDGEISTSRSNLIADSSSFIPKTVTAYASGKNLSKLESAQTEYTIFNNIKTTSQLKVKIKPVDGVKFVPDEVEIYIPVNEFTERKFEIPINAKNIPENMDVKFFPSQAEVTFSVILEEYKKIGPEDFEIVLNYNEFHGNENGRVELKLTHYPSFIRNPRIKPESVEFLLEKH